MDLPGLMRKRYNLPLGKENELLIDSYSRTFKYLRLSVTEKCNFKCSYCLPNGYKGRVTAPFLNINEIKNLAIAFKELGVKKVRLTGGEPTLRMDLPQIIHMLKNDVGIREVALTTNGFCLKQIANQLKSSGLDSINISLDSLSPKIFNEICGADKGQIVLRSIDECIELGFKKVKINCVLLKNLNDNEFYNFIDYVRLRPISVRFIELMRTGDNKEFFKRHHISVFNKIEELINKGWSVVESSETNGPAKEFKSNDSIGRIGFISPYSRDFCTTCNRLRISSLGGLRLCLFNEGDVSLRNLLQKEGDKELLKEKVRVSLRLKPDGHQLHQNKFGNMNSLSAIGG